MQRVLSFPPQSNRRFGDTSEVMSKRMCFSLTFSIMFLSVLAGFLLGRFIFDQELELSKAKLRKMNQQNMANEVRPSQTNASSLISEISSESLQQHLRLLGEGTPESRNGHEARLIRSLMKESDFDLVSSSSDFTINLSYPYGVNQVSLLHGNDVKLTLNDSRTGVTLTDGYHISATVTGNVFYVNFGSYDDYLHLVSLGLTVKDSIVLARVGRAEPVDLVLLALDNEAAGVILYRDPQQKDVESEFLTPADLARLELHKTSNDDVAVPVLCITTQDAERLLGEMSTSEPSSESWRGELNSSYPIGPGFVHPDRKLQMKVNIVTISKKFYDVVGVVRGAEEPDRFVIVAHERTPDETGRESTAIIMEIVKALGISRKTNGWKPYRSIVIASWGIGPHYNTEPGDWWSQIKSKAVAYLKVQSALLGNDSVSSRGSPLLEKAFHEASAQISEDDPQLDPTLLNGGDVSLAISGIPFLRLKQSGCKRIKEVTSFWGYLMWKLSESGKLPFTLDPYVKFFNHSLTAIEKKFKMLTIKRDIFYDIFFEEFQNLIVAMSSFQSKRSFIDSSKSVHMRIINDEFLSFSRALTCQGGTHFSDQSFRHMIFSSSTRGQDPKEGFGLLQDLLQETTWTEAPDDLLEVIRDHLMELKGCMLSVRDSLTDGLKDFVPPK